jgi:enoyl-CoA hydratase/carnithine racemase
VSERPASERPDYFDRYSTIAFERTPQGVVTLRLHSDGGPVAYASAHHRDWAHAFVDVAGDRANQVVILTGTGDSFIEHSAWELPLRTPRDWDRIYWEGKRVLRTLLDIEVPVIGAVNGPATIHAELPLLSDIALAAEHAVFQDGAHAPGGAVPGDGVHVIWPELLGPNRGHYFLLTGQRLSAREAQALGVVSEVLPRERLLPRAHELARQLLAMPELARRYTRVLFTRRWKRLLDESLGYGLALEGLAMLGRSE